MNETSLQLNEMVRSSRDALKIVNGKYEESQKNLTEEEKKVLKEDAKKEVETLMAKHGELKKLCATLRDDVNAVTDGAKAMVKDVVLSKKKAESTDVKSA